MGAVERAKAKLLEAMYRSVERMNCHIVEGNVASVTAEQRLQSDLRKNFEELGERQ